MNENRPRSSSEQPKKRGKAKGIIFGVILALIVAIGLSGFFMYRSMQRVRTEAAKLSETLNTLEAALTSGNPETMRTTIASVHESATIIHNETRGPLWMLAENLPNIGTDIKVTRTLSDVLLDVSENALNPIADNAELLSPESLVSNFANLGKSLEQLVALVREIHPVITRSAETVNALPTPRYTEVSEAKNSTSEVLTTVDESLTLVEGTLDLLEALTQ